MAMSSPRRETPPSYANFSLAKEEPEVVAPSDSTCETFVEKGNAILIGVREFDGSSVKVSEIATKRLERPCVVKPHTDGTCENVGLVSLPLRSIIPCTNPAYAGSCVPNAASALPPARPLRSETCHRLSHAVACGRMQAAR